ncbi:MAG TPA: DUF2059 domain-containing protein [Chlamydiales bacterium]|jgi:hypothetical protein|nr:DUF2059 domain-containing protein [Chlamydiales bacterium]
MKRIFQCLILLSVLQTGFAEEARPSVDSIKELLMVTQAKSLFESTFERVDQYIHTTMEQCFADQEMTEERQQKEKFLREEIGTLLKEELNWDVLEAMYLDIYAQSFSQSEIDSMLSFYKSEGGQAILNKMPILMQNMMNHMENQMKNVLRKVQELQEQTLHSTME